MNLYAQSLVLLTLTVGLNASANTNQSASTEDLDAVIYDTEILAQPALDEEIIQEIEIFEDESDYSLWLEEQESMNAETVYTDEEGNEYYFSEDQVANAKGGGTLKRKRRPRKSARNSCAASNGGASWYGPGFHGRKTANGERFNQNALTAAHKTLPFGSIVRVTFRGKSVDVRINDAGPFVRGRVIDLSKAAAQAIGLIGPGHGNVTLDVISCG